MARALEILVVEDDPLIQRLIEAVFKAATLGAFLVRRASTLEEGITATRTITPDLVLLDLDLPDAKGLEGVRAMLALAPQAAVVILTSNDDDQMAIEAIRLGAQDCIRKLAGLERVLPRAVSFAVERQRQRAEMAAQLAKLRGKA